MYSSDVSIPSARSFVCVIHTAVCSSTPPFEIVSFGLISRNFMKSVVCLFVFSFSTNKNIISFFFHFLSFRLLLFCLSCFFLIRSLWFRSFVLRFEIHRKPKSKCNGRIGVVRLQSERELPQRPKLRLKQTSCWSGMRSDEQSEKNGKKKTEQERDEITKCSESNRMS